MGRLLLLAGCSATPAPSPAAPATTWESPAEFHPPLTTLPLAVISPGTTWTTVAGSLDVRGLAAEGTTGVMWVDDRGHSGTAVGTTEWTIAGLPLDLGDTTLRVMTVGSATSGEVDLRLHRNTFLGVDAAPGISVRGLIVGDKASPVVTVRPTAGTTLNPASLEVVAGTIRASAKDDGVAPDAAAGDGIYTATLSWSPTAVGDTPIELRGADTAGTVEAATLGSLRAVAAPDMPAIEAALATIDTVSETFLATVGDKGALAAQAAAMQSLVDSGAFTSVTIEGSVILLVLASGDELSLDFETPSLLAGGVKLEPATALLGDPFSIGGDLGFLATASCPQAVEPTAKDAAFDVERARDLPVYGLAALVTHGSAHGVRGKPTTTMSTGQILSRRGKVVDAATYRTLYPLTRLDPPELYQSCFAPGKPDARCYYALTPAFVANQTNVITEPHSLVFLDSCESMKLPDMAAAYLANGADQVYGFKTKVTLGFATTVTQDFAKCLVTADAAGAYPTADSCFATQAARVDKDGALPAGLEPSLSEASSTQTGLYACASAGCTECPDGTFPSGDTCLDCRQTTKDVTTCDLGAAPDTSSCDHALCSFGTVNALSPFCLADPNCPCCAEGRGERCGCSKLVETTTTYANGATAKTLTCYDRNGFPNYQGYQGGAAGACVEVEPIPCK